MSEENTGHFAGHLKKYRTFDKTSEAYFATGIIVSRQYSKSSDVGIYQAGTLHPEIIVTLFTQKQISHCYVRQNTGHFAGHLKKYRTFDKTSEAYFATGITVSRQYSKSSDVGIYQAGTLHPEIIVTLFTQKQISYCYVRQLCISEHTTLSDSRQKPTAANIF